MLSVKSSSFEEGIENHTLPQGLREKGRKCNYECPRTSLQHGDSEKEGGNYRVDMELKIPSFFERESVSSTMPWLHWDSWIILIPLQLPL